MLSYKRSTRVAELLQHEISKIIQEMQSQGIGFITVTGVKLTDDLQSARVFYSVIGSEEEIEKSRKMLEDSVHEIRHQIAVRLNLRRTPTLEFKFDITPTHATKIFEILEKIKDEEEKDKESGEEEKK